MKSAFLIYLIGFLVYMTVLLIFESSFGNTIVSHVMIHVMIFAISVIVISVLKTISKKRGGK